MTSIKKIGLFGFGTVGQGFYEVLKKHPHLPIQISKVCVKKLNIPKIDHELYFTTDQTELLDDPDIDIIVELIDDAVAAKQIVETALLHDKHVISANKKMIGESLEEVDRWHINFPSSFLYEAAVGGGIPIIHTMDSFYRNQKVNGICGILNGSSNYILTQMQKNEWEFEQALLDARRKGFAETNATLDTGGFDASYKLGILAYHAFGEIISMKNCELQSIEEVSVENLKKAEAQGKKIKPIARINHIGNEIYCSVKPEEINPDDALYNVDLENNAISVETSISGIHLSIGKGAGALPTGSAVLEDLKRVLNGYKYEVGKIGKKVA